MQSETKECWFQLCQLAAVEQDPAKVLMLVQEICRLLQKKGSPPEANGRIER